MKSSPFSILQDFRFLGAMKKIILFFALFYCAFAFGQNITSDIEKIIRDKRASVGVAVICKDQVFTVSNDEKYPIMSVFKFHIAIATLKKMERDGIALESKVFIEPNCMQKDTWSPLLKKYPFGRIHVSYAEILEYTISHSDNNTCDWLIDFVGGIGKVDACVKSLGIEAFGLSETEKSMGQDIFKTYNNWSTPLSMAKFLRKVYEENVLSKKHFLFLERTMLNSSTGKDKLKAGLPKSVPIAHKTGHSGRTSEGVRICDADAGVIYLPDGEKCYIVVFVKDSRESDDVNAKIIADIAKITYEFLKKRQSCDIGAAQN